VRIEPIEFAGQVVGFDIFAQSAAERVVLRALANLPAVPDTTGSAPCARLRLCPKLPFDNLPPNRH